MIIKSKKQIFKKKFKLILIDLIIVVIVVMLANVDNSLSLILLITLLITSENNLSTSLTKLKIIDFQQTIVVDDFITSMIKIIIFRNIIIYENETIRVKLKTIIDRFFEL